MPLKEFEITEVGKLEDGKEIPFTYTDCFDPDEFLNIVLNPLENLEKRSRCARRLLNVNAISVRKLNRLIRSSTKKFLSNKPI